MTINQLSEKLLLAVKMQQDTTSFVAKIEALPRKELEQELSTDMHKKAFWINIYNAFFQILRKEKGLVKPNIYRDQVIVIAGQAFSLDDIEHGILRKNQYKYPIGFLRKIFSGRLIKRLAVDELDYRIHFALNCGAKSCPPIAFTQQNDWSNNWRQRLFPF